MHTRRLWRFIAIGLIGLIVLCTGAAALIQTTTPPSFRTHRDTVVYALERRGIAYEDILFRQSFEESNNLLSFRAGIQVLRSDGSIVYGWIGCENRDSECFLDLRALDIYGQPLPDLTPATALPAWYIWAERRLRQIDLRTPLRAPTPTPP